MANTKVSKMAASLSGSEIIKLAGEINDLQQKGQKINNLTIGDFNSNEFPIPKLLEDLIIDAYRDHQTNYPPADGIKPLRDSVAKFINDNLQLDYKPTEYLIAGGSRPLIYAVFQTLLDAGDKVVFPVPSWNNNHYTHLSNCKQEIVFATPENNFMPTANDLKDTLHDATLLALCSPLNPTGTMFTEKDLREICELVLAENKRRGDNVKPLYLMYDMVYWTLTYGNNKHFNPVSLVPELRPYTIFIDGLSKAFASTGVRVGWAFGPNHVIDKMKSILGHIGAWAPKPEQVASAKYLTHTNEVHEYLNDLKSKLESRLTSFYNGFEMLRKRGFPIKAISPQAALYLTVQINLKGYKTSDGTEIKNTSDVTSILLNQAGIGIVPFQAFGTNTDDCWYRVSVGNCTAEEPQQVIDKLENLLNTLQKN
jgi:aspartate aminotransferase